MDEDLVYPNGINEVGWTPAAYKAQQAGRGKQVIYCHHCDTWVTFTTKATASVDRHGDSDSFSVYSYMTVTCHWCGATIIEGHGPELDTLDRVH